MIERANQPNAGTAGGPFATSGGQAATPATETARRGSHPWPFPSRYGPKPAGPEGQDQADTHTSGGS